MLSINTGIADSEVANENKLVQMLILSLLF
jgi:hypothetical protein